MKNVAVAAVLALALGALSTPPPAPAQSTDRASMGRGAATGGGPGFANTPSTRRPTLAPAADQYRVGPGMAGQGTTGQWTQGRQWTQGQWMGPSHLPANPPANQPSYRPGSGPTHPAYKPRPYPGPYAPGVVMYGYPVYYPVESYPTPPAYDPGYSMPSPPSVSGPTVMEFANGRYELRGDGVTVPYAWVWIPNPPPPPPPPPAPPTVSTPPATASAPPLGPATTQAAAPRRSQLYRWVDAEGVAHWTDREDAVPAEYRAQARDRRL
jgi:hypothetical protein